MPFIDQVERDVAEGILYRVVDPAWLPYRHTEGPYTMGVFFNRTFNYRTGATFEKSMFVIAFFVFFAIGGFFFVNHLLRDDNEPTDLKRPPALEAIFQKEKALEEAERRRREHAQKKAGGQPAQGLQSAQNVPGARQVGDYVVYDGTDGEEEPLKGGAAQGGKAGGGGSKKKKKKGGNKSSKKNN